jgi:tRNA dimethylallyltransferase
MSENSLVIITGPTSVGKTDISIKLAKRINGEIISADSIQIYKYMDIGSAKITSDDMQGIKHYLIDCLYPDDDFNVFRFKQMAQEAIDEIYSHGKIPIIVGGTGFYIQSILYNIDFSDEPDNNNDIKEKYEKIANEKGNEYVHNLLKEVDSKSAELIHPNNLKRVIRALEYYEIHHEKISVHNDIQRVKQSPYNFSYFVLNRNRDVLYNRIDQRVDIMIKSGLVDEVKKLLKSGYNKELNSMQGLGYKEIVRYLEGEYSLNEAIDIIKRDTRHFAKRQLTWFRREKEVTMLEYENFNNDINSMCDEMIRQLKIKNIV